VSRVVDLAVVVTDGTDERVLAQAGEQSAGCGAAQVAVRGHALTAPERVIERDAAADVQAFPAAVLQWEEERHGTGKVWRETVQD
jgi:hypothetical protein